jgi:hypothetical protein
MVKRLSGASGEELNPVFSECVESISYFGGCLSDEEFIIRARNLTVAIDQERKNRGNDDSVKEMELERLRRENDRRSTEYARRMEALAEEQHRLELMLEKERAGCRRSTAGSSGSGADLLSPVKVAKGPPYVASPLNL